MGVGRMSIIYNPYLAYLMYGEEDWGFGEQDHGF
jgi:hypothetical protein